MGDHDGGAGGATLGGGTKPVAQRHGIERTCWDTFGGLSILIDSCCFTHSPCALKMGDPITMIEPAIY